MEPLRPKRRWIQFSLKGLLVLMLLMSLALGRIANKSHSHSILVQELWDEHIEVSELCPRIYPALLTRLFQVSPVTVDRVLVFNPLDDEQIALLKELPHLKWIELHYSVNDPQSIYEVRSRLKNTPISPALKKHFDASKPDVRRLRAALPEVSTIQVDLEVSGINLSTVAHSKGGGSGGLSSSRMRRK